MLLEKNNVNEQVLQNLITNKVFENKEIEYKDYTFINGKFSSITDKERDKMVKEIAAFANTNGGIVIIGIKEDENRLPIKLSGSGVTMAEYDNWLSSFRQILLARIRPHLHGVDCIPVELTDGTLAIVIFIAKSFSRPHSFWDGNKDEFNIRYANGIAFMDIDDLRKEFLYSSSIQNQIRDFRRDRISMILANETIGSIDEGGKLILHIIPEWSFELGNLIDITKVDGNRNLIPLSGGGWNPRFNIDGYCLYSNNSTTKCVNSYVQLLRNGIIEAVDVRMISGYKPNQVYNWTSVQGQIIKATAQYSQLLHELFVPKPWHIFAAIINAKGFYDDSWYQGTSDALDRNIINSIDSIWSDDDDVDKVLKPILDSLSNAFGYSRSKCYDATGRINYSE